MKYLNIKEDQVSIHQEMDKTSPVIGVLKEGEIVRELKSKIIDGEIWHKIKTRDKVIGYIGGVSVYRLKLVQIDFVDYGDKIDYAVYQNNWPLYYKPFKHEKSSNNLYIGTTCWIIDEIENNEGWWYKIKLPRDDDYFYSETSLQFSQDHINPPGMKTNPFSYFFMFILAMMVLVALGYLFYNIYNPVVTVMSIVIVIFFWVIFGSKIIKRFYRYKY
ncbi:MAG: hypothetical protein JW737_02975 [Acidobacteria bacterium]|nr:hypothetical protein [Acidobacteriota bacterium]